MTLVLDAGALLALERGERRVWTALKIAAQHSADVLVPTSVIAQVWRGGANQARLARALHHCVAAPFDLHAREVGELCGRARTRDVCDAHVAIVAATRGEVLWTSDVPDLKKLLSVYGKGTPVIVRC